MTDRIQSAGRIMGHDAMHRARILHTHPTHACSEQIRQFSGVPMARPAAATIETGAFAPIRERAQGALGGQPC